MRPRPAGGEAAAVRVVEGGGGRPVTDRTPRAAADPGCRRPRPTQRQAGPAAGQERRGSYRARHAPARDGRRRRPDAPDGHAQVRAINSIAGYVAQIRRVGTGHGVWDLDRALHDAAAALHPDVAAPAISAAAAARGPGDCWCVCRRDHAGGIMPP